MKDTLILLAALALGGCDIHNGYDPTSKDGDHGAKVIGGDTFKDSRGETWRLARIDAPELPGHCRPGRDCVEGDPFVATAVLRTLLTEGRPIKCKMVNVDVYSRRIGECYINTGQNISDAMLELGVVEEYKH